MTLALGLIFAHAIDTAADYFPSTAGLKMTYEESGPDGAKSLTVDEIGEATKILDIDVVPIFTRTSARDVASAYYEVTSSGVFLVANAVSQPLPEKMPIIEYVNGKGSWDFTTQIGRGRTQERIAVHGETKSVGNRDVLGAKGPAIECRLEAKTGGGPSRLVETTVSIYANGIGLVESTSTSQLGKQKATRRVKLVKVEAPKKS